MRGSLLTVALALTTLAPAATAAPVEPLGHAGRWMIDARGRVVVLHGFNTVPFNEPTLPIDMGMGRDNAKWLADNGFNTIRLGLYYARVEPQPGVFDDAYLTDYLRVQEELADEGIFTLLDVHQDQLHPRYGTGGPIPSRGFPDWFLKDDGLPNPATPYPAGYTSNPALNRAYDNIWQDFAAPDGESVQAHFARGWQYLIGKFRDRPRMLGYDLFNEPWPGSVWPTCAGATGCPPGGFDQTLLTEFTRELVAAARAADDEHLIFYEPNLLFDFGAPTGVGDPGDPNAGFAFHDYCLAITAGSAPDPFGLCGVNEAVPIVNAEDQFRRTGDALLLSEFGFEQDDARRVTRLADEAMLSWQRWDYYGDVDVALTDRLDALVRAYPQVVAGTPLSWLFDPDARTFRLEYSTERAEGEGASLRPAATAPGRAFPKGAQTEVFVPDRHFSNGYRVEVEGAEVDSREGSRLLVLSSCGDFKRVTLLVAAEGRRTPPPRCAEQTAARRAAELRARRRCVPRRLAVSRHGIGRARLGVRLRALERRYSPVRRGRRWRVFCVRGGGRFVVGARGGRVDLVASTARGHRTRHARPGQRLRSGRLSGARRVGRGLLVGHVGGRNRIVYGVRGGRLRFLAVVRRRAAALPDSLARRLAQIGLIRTRR